MLKVLFDESELTVAPPELSCVTSAEFVLLAVASPEPAVADDVPVFVPELSFIADPPVFPAVLPDASSGSLPMFPSVADPSAHWLFWFSPVTVESAELYPEFALDSCDVPTFECWEITTTPAVVLPRLPRSLIAPAVPAPATPIATAAAPAIVIEHNLIFRLVCNTLTPRRFCVRSAPIVG